MENNIKSLTVLLLLFFITAQCYFVDQQLSNSSIHFVNRTIPSNLTLWNNTRTNNTKWNHLNNTRLLYKNYYYDYTYYNGTTKNGNLILGVISNYDRPLFIKEYKKEGRWWWGLNEIVEYPSEMPSGYINQKIIHAIRIYNLRYQAAWKTEAKVDKGGIGWNFVRIELSSKRGEGFHYLVEIYGR